MKLFAKFCLIGLFSVVFLGWVPAKGHAATDWAQVSAGSYHTLALKADGSLWAWGWNFFGQLGTGTTTDRLIPVQIGTATDWAQVSASHSNSLALKTDGSLWAWGDNGYGQLGDGTTTPQFAPIQIGTDTDWAQVITGHSHSLAVKTDGSLWAWGLNSEGQLGDGTMTDQHAPVQIGTDTDWAQLSAGHAHNLALKADGSLWAWGRNNHGQLGDGTTTVQSAPVQIGTDTDWMQVSAGHAHSLALKTDGSLWAWGDNVTGQLGDGTTTPQLAPVQIGTATDWMQVSAGERHSQAVKADGSLWAWGDNDYGQLGDGTTTQRLAPVQVGTASDWAQVIAGEWHSLALKVDGSLWSWGRNNQGQLGDGTRTNRIFPLQINNGFLLKMVSLPSINGSPADELAVLVQDPDGNLSAVVKDVGSGATLREMPFSNLFIPIDFILVPDQNGNGAPELAMLGVNKETGDVQIHFKDSRWGTWVAPGLINFGREGEPISLSVVPDLNGNGKVELAVFEKNRSTGAPQVRIKDIGTGLWVKSAYFDPQLSPNFLRVLADVNGNGAPELAMLGKDAKGQVKALVKDGATVTWLSTIFYNPHLTPIDLAVIPDLDGNGAAELALLGLDGGGPKIQLKDTDSGKLSGWVYFAPDMTPQALNVVPDVSGNGAAELAVLGTTTSGAVQVLVKDSATGLLVQKVVFDNTYTPKALATVADADGAGHPALAVLGVSAAGGVRVQVKLAADGTLVNNIDLP